MKRKYILAVLVAIVLFLLYSRRVSGLTPACPSGQYYNPTAGQCLQGSISMSSSTATNTSVSTNRKKKQ